MKDEDSLHKSKTDSISLQALPQDSQRLHSHGQLQPSDTSNGLD